MISSPPSAETWDLVGTLFDQLAALPPDQRNLHTLDQPQSVRALLEQMLAAHDTADPQLLDHTVRAVAGTFFAPSQATGETADYRGRNFGAWRALDEIGRGGMAVVLRGERADGRFEKEVAIKLLPRAGRGIEHERLLEEIRILARLEHPNIARLIDGGLEDGIPYLVMEYVHGVPITEYCDGQQLEIKARVRLLMQVVEAVLFAHRHLVVHCDIKPGNILVTGEGQAKLVDFGIAGLISAPSQAAPRGLLCSPAYCAPEQMQGAPPDTAQDVFSLGAVLYELLCGRRLRDNATATRLLFDLPIGPDAVAPPSQYRRGTDRDLDAICLKALASDPGTRYAGANALLTELKRWQTAEPVAARAGGAGYRLGKWLRRHWLPAAAVGITALALIAGTGVALWQARQAGLQADIATHESRRATSARNFLVGLFEGAGPDQRQGRDVTAVELLDQGAQMLLESDSEGPELQAELLVTLAGIYREMGQFDQAGRLLAAAREIDHDPVASNIEAGRLAHAEGRYDAGETAFREALAEIEATQQPRLYAEILSALAEVLAEWGRDDEAEEAIRQALALDGSAGAPDPLATARDHAVAAEIAFARGDLEQAETDLRQALALRGAALGDTHTLVATVQHDLGVTLLQRDATEEAEDAFDRALETRRQLLGAHHADTASTLFNLGALKRRQGDLDAAQANYQEAAEALRALFPDGHPELATVLNSMALAAREQGDTATAIARMQEAIDSARASLGNTHPTVATMLGNLAHLHRAQGQLARAEPIQREAIGILREAVGEEHHLYAVGLNGLAAIERELGREQTAFEHLDQAAGIIAATLGEEHPNYAGILISRAELALAMGLSEQALRDAQTAHDIVEQTLPENHPLHQRVRAVVEAMPDE